ncbi:MAG: hypothetical protein NT084_02260 [Bacteroidetes bacterium]|jgi:hypothetical protein|nr:hypothetical protein [Bacteroidota bacterium]
MKRYFYFIAFVSILIISSCKNGPGPGGQASITGKVHTVGNWNSTCTLYTDSSSGFTPFYAPDYDVYLIYGEDPSYGDRVKTAPDGTYQFNYLRKGKYTVYVYSNDCLAASGKTSVSTTVEITDKKQAVQLSDLRINK